MHIFSGLSTKRYDKTLNSYTNWVHPNLFPETHLPSQVKDKNKLQSDLNSGNDGIDVVKLNREIIQVSIKDPGNNGETLVEVSEKRSKPQKSRVQVPILSLSFVNVFNVLQELNLPNPNDQGQDPTRVDKDFGQLGKILGLILKGLRVWLINTC